MRWIVGLVIAGGLSACGPGELPETFCPETSQTDEPQDASALATEPRNGAGVAIYDISPGTDGADMETVKGFPPDWAPRDGRIQTLVCQYEAKTQSVTAIKYCTGYNTGNGTQVEAPMFAATYHYKAYDASTKQLLGKTDIEGVADCPESVYYEMGSPPKPEPLYADPDDVALINWLRPIVEANH